MTDDELKDMLGSIKLGPEIYDGIVIPYTNGNTYPRNNQGSLELSEDEFKDIPDDTRVMYWCRYFGPVPSRYHQEYFTTWHLWNFMGMSGDYVYMDGYTDRHNGSAVEIVSKPDAIGVVLNAVEYLGEPTAYTVLVGSQKSWYAANGVIVLNSAS